MRNDFKSGYYLAVTSNQNYLAHSAKGTTWTKEGHKWVERFKRAGRWVYVYPITGRGYKNEAMWHDLAARRHKHAADMTTDSNARKKYLQEAIESEQKAKKAKRDYETKSLAGYIEKGSRLIEKLFSSMSSKPTIKTTHTFVDGKKRK